MEILGGGGGGGGQKIFMGVNAPLPYDSLGKYYSEVVLIA